jgi:hypothetical protein
MGIKPVFNENSKMLKVPTPTPTWTTSLSLFTFTIYINPTNSHNKWTFHLRTKRCVCLSVQHLLVTCSTSCTLPNSVVVKVFTPLLFTSTSVKSTDTFFGLFSHYLSI